MECKFAEECANLNKSCYKCFNFNMYSPHKEKTTLRTRSNQNKHIKQGINFENQGTKKYNTTVKQAKEVARRQIASGALHFALGDMITEEEITASLAEFKERGSRDARGVKQITIKKEWLDGIKKEASQMGKEYYFLPFRFKGSDTDYVAIEFDVILSYVQTIQTLVEQIRLLQKEE